MWQKLTHPYFLIGTTAALGFAGGFAARQQQGLSSLAETPSQPKKEKPKPAITDPSLPKSTDTVATLTAITGSDARYDRLALWLLDASEAEIAEYWDTSLKADGIDADTAGLLFFHWTRQDARAALAAAKGTAHEQAAWWAWAIHDPDGALAAIPAPDKELTSSVIWSLINFHPDLALKVVEDPALRPFANVVTLADKVAKQDPEAAIALLAKHHWPDPSGPIRQWARDDPRAALDWLNANSPGNDKRLREAFLETVTRGDPDGLSALAAAAPPGEMKWQLEAAAFRHSLEADPAAALEAARATDSPQLAAERLALVGKKMVEADPQAALGMLAELLEKFPDAASRRLRGATPGGGYERIDEVYEFVDALADWNPRATFEAADAAQGARVPTSRDDSDLRGIAAWGWAAHDLPGFTAWVDAEARPDLRDSGNRTIASQLSQLERYPEAMARIANLTDPRLRRSSTSDFFNAWRNRDAEAAVRWFEAASLPDEIRKELERFLPQAP